MSEGPMGFVWPIQKLFYLMRIYWQKECQSRRRTGKYLINEHHSSIDILLTWVCHMWNQYGIKIYMSYFITSSSEIESQIWTGTRIQNGIQCVKETVHQPGKGFMTLGTTESKDTDYQPKESQTTASNLTYLHLQACETDILEWHNALDHVFASF